MSFKVLQIEHYGYLHTHLYVFQERNYSHSRFYEICIHGIIFWEFPTLP